MVDFKHFDILSSIEPPEIIYTNEKVQQEEQQFGRCCATFTDTIGEEEPFKVDDMQTRSLLPKFQLVNSATFPQMFNPKLFWMSHDSRKLILLTEAENSEFELKVFDTVTCFRAFTLYEQNSDKDVLKQTQFIFSIKMQSDCEVSNAFMSKDYSKLLVELDYNQQKQTIQDEINTINQDSKTSNLLILFDIKDALNKTISLTNDKLIEIQNDQESSNSQVIMKDEMYILNFKRAFDSSFQKTIDQISQSNKNIHHYTVKINQDISSHQLILSFKSQQTYNPNLMIVDFKDPLVNKIVEIQNFNQRYDKIQVKNNYIVHCKCKQDNIIELEGYLYDIESQTLKSQFQQPLLGSMKQIQIVKIEKNKHITYAFSDSSSNYQKRTTIIQLTFENKIQIYSNIAQVVNTLQLGKNWIKEEYKFDQDHLKHYKISKVFMNPSHPQYIVCYFLNGPFGIAKHQERRSIIRTWSTEKDQGFSFKQLEVEARYAFDDIVQNKVKLIERLEPTTFMMVRDIVTQSNSEDESKIERWLGFYRNGTFYNFKRFENYTLKNIPLINYYYKLGR
eukprot:403348496